MKRMLPIAITGMGIVAPSASSPALLWQLAKTGYSPAHLWEPDEANFCTPLSVCSVKESLVIPHQSRRSHRSDRCTQMALLAVSRAWEQAGFAVNPPDAPHRVAVVVGSSRGPVRKSTEAYQKKTARHTLPSLAAESTSACLHGRITSMIQSEGPAYTLTTACSSGAHALALAAEHLLSGSVDIVVAGGVDAPLHAPLIRQFLASGILDPALSPGAVCRPFDQTAAGTILGEAAGFFVMERLDSARKKERPILGCLAGWGLATNGRATSAEAPGFDSLLRASTLALERANANISEIAYVNTHGTGTRLNDDLEMLWLCNMEKQRGHDLPCGSTKPVTGHCLGATPVLESSIVISALQEGFAPPSANCLNPAAGAPQGLILEKSQPIEGNLILSNSLGFWGSAASLVFAKLPA